MFANFKVRNLKSVIKTIRTSKKFPEKNQKVKFLVFNFWASFLGGVETGSMYVQYVQGV